MLEIAYLNGQYLKLNEAKVSVLDRGFLFADGVYEVIPVYSGVLFRLKEHIDRLYRSLEGIRMELDLSYDQWQSIIDGLLKHNDADNGDYAVYVQVTRGAAGERNLGFPADIEPTVLLMMWSVISKPKQQLAQGFSAITVDDIRWSWCYIKSIALLPNQLLNQHAKEVGAFEAIIIKDGEVIEGTSSNVFIVKDGIIKTPPAGMHLLGGITRDVVLEIAETYGLTYKTQAIPEHELYQASEIWITSSTKEIWPVVELNHKPVGEGIAGPMWHHMLELYTKYKHDYVNQYKST